MTLVHVNAEGCLWRMRDPGGPDLAGLLAALPPDRPVPILIHGFRYGPGIAGRDPHETILSHHPRLPDGDLPWPPHLGLTGDGPDLGIAFGWMGYGSFWSARARAAEAGLALAALIGRIRTLSPGRRVTVLAHSLGARVLLSALPATTPGDIARAILLFPAVLRTEVDAALATRGGRATEIVNVTSRENRIFDLFVSFLASGGLDRPAGGGHAARHAGWADLGLDCAETLAHLNLLGFAIGGRERRICHWSSYMRPGVFALYRALIAEPEALSLHRLLPLPRTSEALGDWGEACEPEAFAVN
ncbi:MAG: alpha/beta hydrolase [Rhodobacteraceae bacterium]|nr:alpha/beta hydrolase [Paracoccaceae bacterium]